MAKVMLVFDHDEIQSAFPYALICETRYGRYWDTSKRRRRWLQEFTEKERQDASDIFNRAHNWYVGKGVPDTVRMMPGTYFLWQKIGAFCASL